MDNVFNDLNQMLRGAFAREMKTDILDNDTEYVLEVEVPGIPKENISITYENDELVITAKGVARDKKNYLTVERNTLNMERSYALDDINPDQITAKLENGILTVRVAKQEPKVNPKRTVEIL